MVDIHDEARAGGVDLEGLQQRRAVARGAVAAVDEGDGVEHGCLPDGRDVAGLVDHADADGIGAEGIDLPGAGIRVDEGVGAGSGGGVELVHQEGNGTVGAVAVVLDFVEADHVRIHGDDGSDGLDPLAVKFSLGGRAAAVGIRAAGEAAGVAALPSAKVLKKLSRFMPTTLVVPPTAGTEVGRGLAASKLIYPPMALIGRTR